ncbi:ROK family protein [Fundicoccus culcitae]|uniref:ROK family protein n=1 Tax=Fundicoccus culcitae TaxID=2969821 RepID=A0ABY5P546_9LACT|nr:ROK family protein [Fundicoccus culcitae]UUX33814.1 ROK family protein [Fundicoccus culcitae]
MQINTSAWAIGVDIGGTKIAAALIDDKGAIHHRQQIKTPTQSAETLFKAVVKSIQTVLDNAQLQVSDIQGIGLGVPGKVDIHNGIAVYQNNLPWGNFPVVARLQAVFPDTKIAIDNDVKVAAYAEYRAAALGEDEIFTYLTISTGIASTTIVNNQILRGAGFAGEVGFLPINFAKPYHTLENNAAGPGIESRARIIYGNKRLTTADVFSDWATEVEPGYTIVEKTISDVALAVYSMICFLDPTAITLGGSVTLKNPTYLQSLNKYLLKWLHPEQMHIISRLSLSTMGSDNGLIGAAWLVMS